MKFSDRPFEPFYQHPDKILFGIGFVYLICVSSWLTTQNRLIWPWQKPPRSVDILLKTPIPDTDAQFIGYLQRSLKTISSSGSSEKASPAIALNPPKSQSENILPLSIQIPQNQTPPPPTTPTVIERVYIPVYPPQTAKITQNLPPSQPPLTAMIPRPTVAISLPKVPLSAPLPKAIPPLLTNHTPYALVGVLESGDRSSALFTENGLTQRIQVGERIGSSNWILKGVENQKAILFNQDKMRYLEVGQKF